MLGQEKPKSWVTGSISNLNNMKINITTKKKQRKIYKRTRSEPIQIIKKLSVVGRGCKKIIKKTLLN